MAQDEDVRDQMAQIRQRIQQKKQSAKNLSGLFQGAQPQRQKKAPGKILTAIKETAADNRVLAAVAGYLDIISSSQIDAIEKAYPLTTSALFELAQTIIAGEFGVRIQNDARALQTRILQWGVIVRLLVVNELKTPKEAGLLPEIFTPFKSSLEELQSLRRDTPLDKQDAWLYNTEPSDLTPFFVKVDTLVSLIHLSSLEQKTFEKIFKKYLDHAVHPSSSGIDVMLKKEKSLEKTVKQAFTIKNVTERSKSIGNIVGNLLQSNSVDQAIQIVGSIKAKKEVSKPLTHLVKQLLNPKRRDIEQLVRENKIDEAVEIANTLTDTGERNKIYQRLISGLSLHRQVDKALEIADRISDPEVRDFSLSSLVSGLVLRSDFESATHVARMITDPDYRDDANAYIVRGLLDSLSFADAVAFVSNLVHPVERSRAARVVLSWARSVHNQEKVDEVSSLFGLAI